MTQRELADAIKGDQGSVSKWEAGKITPSVADLVAVEQATGRPRGFVFIAAGLVDLPSDTRSAIAADPALPDLARRLLLRSYDEALEGE